MMQLQKLVDKNIGKEERKKYIEKLAADNVDINALGLYTPWGELRKSTDKAVLEEYQNTFKKYF